MAKLTSADSGRDPEEPANLIALSQKNSSTQTVVYRTISLWLDRMRRRRMLENLAERNNYLLADVGLTREQALREAAKPFWLA